jgi:hypothetical protein
VLVSWDDSWDRSSLLLANERPKVTTQIFTNQTDLRSRPPLEPLFVENAVHGADDLVATAFGDTTLGREVYSNLVTDEATEAIHRGNDLVLSHLVGLTEQDPDGGLGAVGKRPVCEDGDAVGIGPDRGS